MKRRIVSTAISLILAVAVMLPSMVVAFAEETPASVIPAEAYDMLEDITTMDFAHEGMLLSFEELDLIKEKIEAKEEPYYSSFLTLKSSSHASLTSPTTAFEYPSSNLFGYDAVGTTEEQNAATDAYTLALMWYFTEDERYAEHAVDILNSWGRTLKGHKGGNWYLQASWAASVFPLGAEILRSTYDGWEDEDIEQFKTMLSTVFLPIFNNRYSYGNRELSVINALVAIGVFCDDRAAVYQGVYNWIDYVPSYYYIDSDNSNPKLPAYHINKPSKDFYLSLQSDIYPNPDDSWLNLSNNPFGGGDDVTGITGGNLNSLWYNPGTFVNGLCGETGRDLGHVEMAIASTINTAEIMYHQGIDLYSLYADRLVAASEKISAFRLGEPIPSDLFGGYIEGLGTSATYEILYNHYHNRLGIDMPRTNQILRTLVRKAGNYAYSSPKGFLANKVGAVTGLCAAWETLTHGQPLEAGEPAPALDTITLKQGTIMGTTAFDTVPDGDLYYVKGAAGEYEAPYLGDIATLFVNPVVPDENITAMAGEHIYIVEVDDMRNVLGFSEIAVTADDIMQWPEGTVTLKASEDAFLRPNQPDQNTGSWGIDVGGSLEVYFKFNISDIESASKAIFRLYMTSLNDHGDNYINVYGVSDNTWQEMSITYNNAPRVDTGRITYEYTDEINKYYEFDVSSYVQSQVALGKDYITLVIDAKQTQSYFQFGARTTNTPPQLVIAPETDAVLPAYPLGGFIWDKGTANNTTTVTSIPAGYGTIRYLVGEAGEKTRPYVGESAEDYVRTLTVGENIRVASGQHIYLAQVDTDGTIKGWMDVPVADENIYVFQPRVADYTAVADVHNNRAGNFAKLEVGTNPGYFMFTVNDMTSVDEAILNVYGGAGYCRTSGNLTFYVYGVGGETIDEANWVKGSVGPTLPDTPLASFKSSEEPTASNTTRTFNTWYRIDVTDYVNSMLKDGISTFTIAIRGANTTQCDGLEIQTKEGSNKPFLKLTESPAERVNVSGIELSDDEAEIKVDKTLRLAETVLPANANNQLVEWSSSNPAVAAVDSNGLVRAIAVGTADITVTTVEGGYSATCTVTVTEEDYTIVDNIIQALPEVAELTLDDADAVAEASEAFNALSDSDKAMVSVSSRNKLTAAIAKIAELQSPSATASGTHR